MLDLGVGVDGFVRFHELFHQGCHAGGAAHDDLAGGLGAGEGFALAADVALVGGKRLTVSAQAVGEEVHGNGVGGVAVGDEVERTGKGVAAVLDGVGTRLDAVHGDRLDGVVQRAKADVADGGGIVGNGGHNAVGAALHGGGFGRPIDLFAVGVLLLDAGQLNESAAGAGAVLTGEHGDVLRGVKGTGGSGGGGGSAAGSQTCQHSGGQYRSGNSVMFHSSDFSLSVPVGTALL